MEQRNSGSKLTVRFTIEMKLRLRFPTNRVLLQMGSKNNVCIQLWVEFGKLRSFCVGLIFFNALVVLSHFIGSKGVSIRIFCTSKFRSFQGLITNQIWVGFLLGPSSVHSEKEEIEVSNFEVEIH